MPNPPSPPTRAAASVRCFAPIAQTGARILILGSMPGRASLRAAQYYAHPRNAFWPIMAAVLGFDPHLPYLERLAALQSHGFALWDVLAACDRVGSLDAEIDLDSAVANDFESFFDRNTNLARIVFNGALAEQCFRRHLPPATRGRIADQRRLPSTSPAHAGMRFEAKLAQWQDALNLGRSL